MCKVFPGYSGSLDRLTLPGKYSWRGSFTYCTHTDSLISPFPTSSFCHKRSLTPRQVQGQQVCWRATRCEENRETADSNKHFPKLSAGGTSWTHFHGDHGSCGNTKAESSGHRDHLVQRGVMICSLALCWKSLPPFS